MVDEAQRQRTRVRPKRDSDPLGNLRRAMRGLRNRRQSIDDRKNYGAGIMAARAANNPNIDSEGYNRSILNKIYGPAFLGYNEDPNRRSQMMIDRIMDFDQRDSDTPVDTLELGQYTDALNALNDARLSKRLVNEMYLPDEDNPYEDLPQIAYAIDGPGMVQGQDLPMPDVGMPVRAGDLYGDPTYSGNYGTMTPSSMYQGTDIANSENVYRMGRGNPYLQDLSYTMAGPSTNYFSEELDEDGNVEGYSMNTAADGTEFVDPGYNIRDIPTERRFEGTLRDLMDGGLQGDMVPKFMPIPLAQPGDSQGAFLGDVGYSNDPYFEMGSGIEYVAPIGGGTSYTGVPYGDADNNLGRVYPDPNEVLRPVEKRQFPDEMAGTFGLPFNLFQDPGADGGFYDYLGRKIQGDEIDEENYEPYQEPTLEEKRRRFMETYG